MTILQAQGIAPAQILFQRHADMRYKGQEDGAEVLILGCTVEYGFHETMQAELGVPVIDAVLAPFKMAELLAETAHRFGWCPSRKWGSEAPPSAEIEAWQLFNQAPPAFEQRIKATV